MPKVDYNCAIGNAPVKTIVAAVNTDISTLDTNRIWISNPGGAPVSIWALGSDSNITMRIAFADPGITLKHNPPWINTMGGVDRVANVGDVGVYTVGDTAGNFAEESWGNTNVAASASVAARVTTLEGQVSTLQSQVSTLQSQMTSLTSRVTALESWKTTVDAYMTAHP